MGKIRDMIDLSNQIGTLKEDFSQIKNSIIEMKDSFQKDFEINKELKKKELKDISDIKLELHELKKDFTNKLNHFDSELKSFDITKKNIQEKLYNEFLFETKKISSDMKDHLNYYKELEITMKDANSKIKDFSSNLEDIKQLSKTISKKDFELKNYQSILEKNDSEKVNLLKKIDSLERLLASMKRNKR